MNRFFFLLSIFIVCQTFGFLYAQNNEIQVSGVTCQKYPDFSGQLSVRNPNKIDISKISFFEGDTELKVSFSSPNRAKDVSKNKSVLFVVLNNQTHRDRTRWYQSVMRNALNRNMMKPGDEFSLVTFDCNRPEYSEDKQLLFPKIPSFTTNPSDFKNQINSIDLTIDVHRICKERSEIHLAILKALKLIDSLGTNNSKSIVVLADDWGRERLNDDITDLARSTNIPIYGITYHQGLNRHHGIEDVCKNSYGDYARDVKNNVDTMSDQLLSFMNGQIQRASGWVYDFSFSSPHKKDGKNHSVRVQYKSNQQITGFQYSDPKQTFSDWVSANKILFVGLILLVLLITVLLFVFIKKRKRERMEAERLQIEELDKVKSQQKDAEIKAAEQEEALNKMKADKMKEIQNAEAAKLKKEKEEKDALKLQEMSARGNLPWFTFEFNGESGSVEMNAPEFSFGRDKDVNFTLNSRTVSRKHFIVIYESASYTIQDLNSSNGTLVNGTKITQSKLNHGDVISAGEILLTFHI